MELLIKTIKDAENPRNDNSDKKELFPADNHPQSASLYKDQWAFIEDEAIRDNIAYQMQYIEFLIKLYNGYQIYLTAESLLCKTIIVNIASVIEGALTYLVISSAQKGNWDIPQNGGFKSILARAQGMGYIDRNMRGSLSYLWDQRNHIHLNDIRLKEYDLYTIDAANSWLKKLEEFRENMINLSK